MSIVAYVENCYRYPVKGCRAISSEIRVSPEDGIKRDRKFVVVSQSKTSERFPFGKAITQRQFPGLAIIKVEEMSSDGYRLTYNDGVAELSVWLSSYSERKLEEELFTIHKVDMPAVGERVDNDELRYFFEKILGIEVRVYMVPYDHPRKHASKHLERDLRLGFADSHPVLITNTRSLSEVNLKLTEKDLDIVPMSRFRPNIVVSSPLPWQEDGWRVVRIGSAVFEHAELCGRCQVTTIDQWNGLVNKDKEPLVTLNKLRPARGGPIFGSYYAIRKSGVINPGAHVERLE